MLPETRRKLLVTAALYLTFFASGVTFAILPPSLTILQHRVDTDSAEISRLYTARSAGYLLGALSGGILFNLINRQLCLIVLVAVMSVTLYSITLMTSLTGLLTIGFVNGFSSGGSDTAINVFVLEMWAERANPFMQALHFFFALGTGSAPLIAAPYLPDELQSTGGNGTASSVPDGDIVPPYSIGAGVIMAASFCLAFIYWLCPESRNGFVPQFVSGESSDQKVAAEPIDTSNNHRQQQERSSGGGVLALLYQYRQWMFDKQNRRVITLIAIFFVIILIYSGMEIIYLQFLPKFLEHQSQKLPTPFTQRETSFIYAAMNYSYTLSRLFGVFLATRLSAQTMIYLDCSLMTIGCVVMIAGSASSKIANWIGNIIMGAGFASIYASLYAFIEEHLEVTNFIGSLFVFSSGLTAVVYPVIIGNYIESYPMVLLWFTLPSVLATWTIFSLSHYFLSRGREVIYRC